MAIRLEDEFERRNTRNYRLRKVVALAAALIAVTLILYGMLLNTNSAHKLRLYTHNIRYDNRRLTPGEQYWEKRGPLVAKSIAEHTEDEPAVVCLQEVLYNQLKDIHHSLNKHEPWSYYGIGRQDGGKKGEFSPIFYKEAEWDLKSSRTYWLSETPEKPSRGWDAALERIVTEVILQHKKTHKTIKVLNTHFDHQGVVARRELVKLIMSKMQQGAEPAFLCGDFNTEPTDEPYSILKTSGFTDSRTAQVNADAKTGTFTGFDRKHEESKIIDYIWADEKAAWQSYHVLPNYFDFHMSDHRPVTAEFLI